MTFTPASGPVPVPAGASATTPLIIEKSHIDQIFSMLADILKNLD